MARGPCAIQPAAQPVPHVRRRRRHRRSPCRCRTGRRLRDPRRCGDRSRPAARRRAPQPSRTRRNRRRAHRAACPNGNTPGVASVHGCFSKPYTASSTPTSTWPSASLSSMHSTSARPPGIRAGGSSPCPADPPTACGFRQGASVPASAAERCFHPWRPGLLHALEEHGPTTFKLSGDFGLAGLSRREWAQPWADRPWRRSGWAWAVGPCFPWCAPPCWMP